MTRFLTFSLAGCLTLAWSVGEAQTTSTPKPYVYNMKTTVSRPAGSPAAESFKDKTKPSTTALTPCKADALKQNALSFNLLYDAGQRKFDKKTSSVVSSLKDVYFFFYNPEALGLSPGAAPDDLTALSDAYPELCELDATSVQACDPKVWVLDRPALKREPLAMRPLADRSYIRLGDPDHIYLSVNENLGTGKINDMALRSFMSFDEVSQGLWSLVGIIGDSATVNFDDPSTWAAWDAVAFMLGSPWANDSLCNPE